MLRALACLPSLPSSPSIPRAVRKLTLATRVLARRRPSRGIGAEAHARAAWLGLAWLGFAVIGLVKVLTCARGASAVVATCHGGRYKTVRVYNILNCASHFVGSALTVQQPAYSIPLCLRKICASAGKKHSNATLSCLRASSRTLRLVLSLLHSRINRRSRTIFRATRLQPMLTRATDLLLRTTGWPVKQRIRMPSTHCLSRRF